MNREAKILELNFEKTWRGGERQTLYNMVGFKQAGYEVELVCKKGFPMEKKAHELNFKIHSFKSAFSVYFFLVFKGKNYKFLHAQTSHILTYCVFSKWFHKTPIVFSRKVDFIPKGYLTKLKYKWTNYLTGVSEAIKIIIEKFSNKKVTVVSDIAVKQNLNKERALNVLNAKNISTHKRVIGTLAAFVGHKDPFTMVEAIKLLSEKRKDFVFLHFGNGELQAVIQEKIKEYNLEDYYKLMGFYDNAEDFFSILEVFVMSSKEEGLGSSVLDAFLYEVPVASTNAGGLKDLVEDNRAESCEKQNPKQLAECIDVLLSQPEKANEHVKNAKGYVEKFHSMQFITSKYLNLFQNK
ncbi:MAG: glycosyltransferase [Bacteroidota bacterium]|nr:glycosyltransferase [Bacteroidota bacterium]